MGFAGPVPSVYSPTHYTLSGNGRIIDIIFRVALAVTSTARRFTFVLQASYPSLSLGSGQYEVQLHAQCQLDGFGDRSRKVLLIYLQLS